LANEIVALHARLAIARGAVVFGEGA
jgi:hypothetical protein